MSIVPAWEEIKIAGKGKEVKFSNEVLWDYWICCISREVSLLGRKEVLTGKAKFGILGDGKELPQVAMARAFKKGDFRSGYYRDQTLMFALGLSSVEDYFAQLYADPDNDPFSGGRQMNAHFATRMVDENGHWLNAKEHYNISSDISPTAGQMARGLGLAMASKWYREEKALKGDNQFSDKGNEVCFVTIGDASTSEGIFFETINAAAVMQVPLAVSVWDDGYGISVPKKYQTTKESISEILSGFQQEGDSNGIDIYTCKAWDYPALMAMYERGIKRVREKHIPALFHVEEVTQPQGHSTSGSHERYKSEDRLKWEQEMDCIIKFEEWISANGIKTREELAEIREKAIKYTRQAKAEAWKRFSSKVTTARKELRSSCFKDSSRYRRCPIGQGNPGRIERSF